MNTLKVLKLNSVFLSLGTLAILTFGILSIPSYAHADRAGVVTPYGSTPFNNNISPYSGYNSYQDPAPTYTPPATTTNPPTVNTTNTNTDAGQVQGASTSKTTTTTTTEKKIDNKSELAASATLSGNGFLPSGLLQWIFFAILILLIVILVRKILGADKKYHSTPLKHA